MATTKFHINDAGEIGICKASIKECKFGANGESTGTGVDGHYTSKEEATAAAEKFMENKYKEVYKGYRRGENEGMNLATSMKKRLISEAESGSVHVFPASIGRVLSKDKDELIRKTVAETLSSQKLLRDMADDESARVRKAVALRINNREVLAKLANDPDRSVQLAALQNSKTPVKARKAGQSAIREANIRNLAKAREVSQKDKPKSVGVGQAPTIRSVQEQLSANSKSASARAWEVFEDARVDPLGSLTERRRTPRERALAEIHGVTQDKVVFDPTSQNTHVRLGEEIQLYGPKGQNRGRASAAIEKKVDSVRRKADALHKRAMSRNGVFYGSSKISEGLITAHGPDTSVSKTGPFNDRDVYYKVKSGYDGQTYVYEANTYRLIEVQP